MIEQKLTLNSSQTQNQLRLPDRQIKSIPNGKWSLNVQQIVNRTQRNLERGAPELTRILSSDKSLNQPGYFPQKFLQDENSATRSNTLLCDLNSQQQIEQQALPYSRSVRNMARSSSHTMGTFGGPPPSKTFVNRITQRTSNQVLLSQRENLNHQDSNSIHTSRERLQEQFYIQAAPQSVESHAPDIYLETDEPEEDFEAQIINAGRQKSQNRDTVTKKVSEIETFQKIFQDEIIKRVKEIQKYTKSLHLQLKKQQNTCTELHESHQHLEIQLVSLKSKLDSRGPATDLTQMHQQIEDLRETFLPQIQVQTTKSLTSITDLVSQLQFDIQSSQSQLKFDLQQKITEMRQQIERSKPLDAKTLEASILAKVGGMIHDSQDTNEELFAQIDQLRGMVNRIESQPVTSFTTQVARDKRLEQEIKTLGIRCDKFEHRMIQEQDPRVIDAKVEKNLQLELSNLSQIIEKNEQKLIQCQEQILKLDHPSDQSSKISEQLCKQLRSEVLHQLQEVESSLGRRFSESKKFFEAKLEPLQALEIKTELLSTKINENQNTLNTLSSKLKQQQIDNKITAQTLFDNQSSIQAQQISKNVSADIENKFDSKVEAVEANILVQLKALQLETQQIEQRGSQRLKKGLSQLQISLQGQINDKSPPVKGIDNLTDTNSNSLQPQQDINFSIKESVKLLEQKLLSELMSVKKEAESMVNQLDIQSKLRLKKAIAQVNPNQAVLSNTAPEQTVQSTKGNNLTGSQLQEIISEVEVRIQESLVKTDLKNHQKQLKQLDDYIKNDIKSVLSKLEKSVEQMITKDAANQIIEQSLNPINQQISMMEAKIHFVKNSVKSQPQTGGDYSFTSDSNPQLKEIERKLISYGSDLDQAISEVKTSIQQQDNQTQSKIRQIQKEIAQINQDKFQVQPQIQQLPKESITESRLQQVIKEAESRIRDNGSVNVLEQIQPTLSEHMKQFQAQSHSVSMQIMDQNQCVANLINTVKNLEKEFLKVKSTKDIEEELQVLRQQFSTLDNSFNEKSQSGTSASTKLLDELEQRLTQDLNATGKEIKDLHHQFQDLKQQIEGSKSENQFQDNLQKQLYPIRLNLSSLEANISQLAQKIQQSKVDSAEPVNLKQLEENLSVLIDVKLAQQDAQIQARIKQIWAWIEEKELKSTRYAVVSEDRLQSVVCDMEMNLEQLIAKTKAAQEILRASDLEMLEQRIDEAIEHTDLKHNSILEGLKALSESVSFLKKEIVRLDKVSSEGSGSPSQDVYNLVLELAERMQQAEDKIENIDGSGSSQLKANNNAPSQDLYNLVLELSDRMLVVEENLESINSHPNQPKEQIITQNDSSSSIEISNETVPVDNSETTNVQQTLAQIQTKLSQIEKCDFGTMITNLDQELKEQIQSLWQKLNVEIESRMKEVNQAHHKAIQTTSSTTDSKMQRDILMSIEKNSSEIEKLNKSVDLIITSQQNEKERYSDEIQNQINLIRSDLLHSIQEVLTANSLQLEKCNQGVSEAMQRNQIEIETVKQSMDKKMIVLSKIVKAIEIEMKQRKSVNSHLKLVKGKQMTIQVENCDQESNFQSEDHRGNLSENYENALMKRSQKLSISGPFTTSMKFDDDILSRNDFQSRREIQVVDFDLRRSEIEIEQNFFKSELVSERMPDQSCHDGSMILLEKIEIQSLGFNLTREKEDKANDQAIQMFIMGEIIEALKIHLATNNL